MSLNLLPGHVLCPPCSGTGCGWWGITGNCGLPCKLCEGRGEVHADLAEDFWECMRLGARKPHLRRCESV